MITSKYRRSQPISEGALSASLAPLKKCFLSLQESQRCVSILLDLTLVPIHGLMQRLSFDSYSRPDGTCLQNQD
jgi:hypothetical protein